MRKISVTRYVTPLREGGSLPGIVEADDLGTYVCKFRGAGQGLPVLVAEVIVGELARTLGIRTPDLVGIDLVDAIARYEADEEVQDLLNASLGLNLGVDFLPGSFGFDPGLEVDDATAGRILWLDAFVANVDRSWRNPNLLVWHGDLWAIDHGASLYFHHAWTGGLTDPGRFAEQPWSVDDHVLRAHVDAVAGVTDELAAAVTDDLLREVTALVPDDWLVGPVAASELRSAYVANVDRSWRNPNLLVWHGDLWAIDHGASLYFHHAWTGGITDPARFAEQPWSVDDHVLRAHVGAVAGVADELAESVTDELLREVTLLVPDEWLVGPVPASELRAAYVAFLQARLDGSRSWLPRRGAA